MIDFKIDDISQIQKKIQSHNSVSESDKNNPFWHEWNLIYLQMKESLITDDMDYIFKSNKEIIEAYKNAIKLYSEIQLKEAIEINQNFLITKIVEVLVFLKTLFKERLLMKHRVDNLNDAEVFSKTETEVKTKRKEIWNLLQNYLAIFENKKDKAAEIISKNLAPNSTQFLNGVNASEEIAGEKVKSQLTKTMKKHYFKDD